jgi:hypothetical protein
VLLVPSGSAQVATSASASLDASGAVRYRTSIVLRPPAEFPAVAGAPYAAEEVVSSFSLTADGRRVDQPESHRKLYRDSAGRTRVEQRLSLAPEASDRPLLIQITDPVAGYYYVLDLDRRVAHRAAIPRPGGGSHENDEPPVAISPEGAEPAGPKPFVEKLGKRSVDGLGVEGVRHTLTLSDGSNGPPRYSVSEIWKSPELGVTVLQELNDSLKGTRTTRLRNISRTEPDASLFQVPPGFTVRDHAAKIEIELNFR